MVSFPDGGKLRCQIEVVGSYGELEFRKKIEEKLAHIRQRYDLSWESFDFSNVIFDEQSGLDSLDIAEVFAWIEQQFGVSAVDLNQTRIETWDDLIREVVNRIKI